MIERLKQLRTQFLDEEDAGTLTDERHDALLDEMDQLWAGMSRPEKDEYNAWNRALTEARLLSEYALTLEQREAAKAKLGALVEAAKRREEP